MVYFETAFGRVLESHSRLGHGLGPCDMPFEAKPFRQVAVAIVKVAVGGLVAVSPRHQCPQPQQPDVACHKTW